MTRVLVPQGLVFTTYEPVLRWYGVIRCKWRLDQRFLIDGQTAYVTIAEGWMPDVGLGYREVVGNVTHQAALGTPRSG